MSAWLKAFFIAAGMFVATTVCAKLAGYVVNISHSMPMGIYRLTSVMPQRGSVVSTCIDAGNQVMTIAIERRYFPTGKCPDGLMPFLKTVAALPGDIVDIEQASIYVNNVPVPHTQRILTDWLSRPLPHVKEGRYRVGPGQVFLLASHSPDSFDGRYFGLTSQREIQGVAKPVYVEH